MKRVPHKKNEKYILIRVVIILLFFFSGVGIVSLIQSFQIHAYCQTQAEKRGPMQVVRILPATATENQQKLVVKDIDTQFKKEVDCEMEQRVLGLF